MENAKVVPQHIGFIMDGNGRWAKERGKSRNHGHLKGANNVKNVVKWSFKEGVKVVSLYAFSTENWSRPKNEVDKLFSLLEDFLKKDLKDVVKNKIKIIFSGNLDRLPETLKNLCLQKMAETSSFDNFVVNIALNYGSRQEIVTAVNKLIKSGKKSVTEEDIKNNLYTKHLPDIDLIVRTSGEQRISNFFLFQSAYAELYFTNAYWPDFNKQEFDKAISEYSKRNRRFGSV